MKIKTVLLALAPLIIVVGCEKKTAQVDSDRSVVIRESSVTNTERIVATADAPATNARVDINIDARTGQPVSESAGATKVEKETTINIEAPKVEKTENSVTITAPKVEKSETTVQVETTDADRTLTTRVRETITADTSLSAIAPNIQISSASGRVLLKGTVSSEKEKQDIAAKVQAIAGDDKVDNQIEVKAQ